MYTNLKGKKAAIYTLGCKVNQYESDGMSDMLKSQGMMMVSFTEIADIYIINTCSVTNMAERKSRQIIHRARKLNPEAIVVACGCYVQAAKDSLKSDCGIDVIVGNNRKKDIARILSEYIEENEVEDNYIDINNTNEYENMTLVKPTEHCRAYVKIQDGCNNFCTYCIIPYTRGRIRSRKLSDIVDEVEGLANTGIKEVVVTGINISSYKDDENHSLIDVLTSIACVDGIARVRMGSLEPGIITREFLDEMKKYDKICPHFHLSLQSACDATLKRMNRKYTIGEYMKKCELIRQIYDRPAITTDVIVGFPGETDEEFEMTVNMLEKLDLYEMHVFKYSRRDGTIAAGMPNQVPDSKKDERSSILISMAQEHKKRFEDKFRGEKLQILVEEWEKKGGKSFFKGHTDRYIMIEQEAEEDICRQSVNEIIEVVF